MKAEREWFDPAKRSILAKTSPDSVIDVFAFILLIYHPGGIHASMVGPGRIGDFALASGREGWRGHQMSPSVGSLWKAQASRAAVVVRCHSNRLPAMPLRTSQQSVPITKWSRITCSEGGDTRQWKSQSRNLDCSIGRERGIGSEKSRGLPCEGLVKLEQGTVPGIGIGEKHGVRQIFAQPIGI